MSNIIPIYAALAAKAVTTTSGVTPKTYNLHELPESMDTARMPCRLLLPLGGNPGEGRDAQFYAIGDQITVQWVVNDLMLWQPSEQGLGLREYAPELVDYCGKYLEAMRDLKCPYANSTLDSIMVTPGEYEWPRGSGRFYAGVACQLVITEAMNG